MSELKITYDSIENAILKDGLLVFGSVFGDNSSIYTNKGGAIAHGYIQNGMIIADASGAHAEGYALDGSILATGLGAHAEGCNTLVFGTASHAEGYLTKIIMYYELYENSPYKATGRYTDQNSITVDRNPINYFYIGQTVYINDVPFIIGYLSNGPLYIRFTENISDEMVEWAKNNYIKIKKSIIIGGATGAHAEGLNTIAIGDGAHVEGYQTSAGQIIDTGYRISCRKPISGGVDYYSVWLNLSWAGGNFNIGEKLYINNNLYEIRDIIDGGPTTLTFTTQISDDDIIWGQNNNILKLKGNYSHAEGINTLALADGAHAGGIGTIANKEAMTAIGKYNSLDTKIYGDDTLFVIGNGNSTTRKNVLNINNSGSIYFNNNYVYFNKFDTDNNYIKSNANNLEINANEELILLADDQVTINSDKQVIINSDITKISSIVTAKVNNVNNVYLGCPIGTIVMWPGIIDPTQGSYPPDGWLLCDGSTLNNSSGEYNNLYYVIGLNYGGTDQTSFNLPDLQQKFPLGAKANGTIGKNGHSSDSPGWNTSLGCIGGEPTNTLDIKEMPVHNHKVDHLDPGNGSTTDNDITFKAGTMTTLQSTESAVFLEVTSNSNQYLSSDTIIHSTENKNRGDQIIKFEGSSDKHNNIPPFLALNFIIKYK